MSKLPTRVIDVGWHDGRTEPKLCIPSEDFAPGADYGRHIAWSYCWGPLPFLTTTSSTLKERRQEIPMASLPASLRDAILITRELGIRYLWIDALCIIQGSDEEGLHDWHVESDLMHAIYGGAFLTICAASSPKAQHGILVDRAQPVVSHVKMPWGQHSMILGERRLLSGREPLDSRGALQEKLLSHRILTYNSTEIIWHCQCIEWRESGEPGRGPTQLLEWYQVMEVLLDWIGMLCTES